MLSSLVLDLLLLALASRLLAAALQGLYLACSPGYLLYPLCRWVEHRVAAVWLQPLWLCPVCMASVYGSLWAALLLPYLTELPAAVGWLLLVAATAGWNANPHRASAAA